MEGLEFPVSRLRGTRECLEFRVPGFQLEELDKLDLLAGGLYFRCKGQSREISPVAQYQFLCLTSAFAAITSNEVVIAAHNVVMIMFAVPRSSWADYEI